MSYAILSISPQISYPSSNALSSWNPWGMPVAKRPRVDEDSLEEFLEDAPQRPQKVPKTTAGDAQTILGLVERLKTGEDGDRVAAAEELRSIFEKPGQKKLAKAAFGAIKPLVGLLRSRGSEGKAAAAELLMGLAAVDDDKLGLKAEISASDPLDPLVRLLKDGPDDAKIAAAKALSHPAIAAITSVMDGSVATIRLLVDLLKDGSTEIRSAAALSLAALAAKAQNHAKIDKASAVPALVDLLRRQDAPENHAAAAKALHKLASSDTNRKSIADANAIPLLVSMLKGGSPDGKTEAARAIASLAENAENKAKILANPATIRSLTALSKTGSQERKAVATLALSNLGVQKT